MKRTKRFLGIIPILFFLLSSSVLKAQIPAAIDTKMKSDNMRNFQLEEIKVRWKKAALENCPGVPCVTAPASTCGTSTVTDVDGNVYNTVNVGTQVWTRENLKVTKYNDGTTVIPDETSNASWHLLFYGARAEYVAAGVTGYVSTYGYLYNWYAAAGIITAGGTSTKNICPVGWHVPNDADWTTLIRFIDINEITILNGTQSLIAGGKIKEKGTTHWGVESPGTDNSTCFTALPGGYRRASSFGNGYSNLPWYAYFWSSTSDPVDNTKALYRELYDSSNDIDRRSWDKGYGYSVRCVKD
jgi:uncharacterized protein (TIGR02145 family)